MTFETAPRSDTLELSALAGTMGLVEAHVRRRSADSIELFRHFTATVGAIRQIDDPNAIERCERM